MTDYNTGIFTPKKGNPLAAYDSFIRMNTIERKRNLEEILYTSPELYSYRSISIQSQVEKITTCELWMATGIFSTRQDSFSWSMVILELNRGSVNCSIFKQSTSTCKWYPARLSKVSSIKYTEWTNLNPNAKDSKTWRLERHLNLQMMSSIRPLDIGG